MPSDTFDAIVLGTGQAGKPLATALAEAGRRTAIVERGPVGGTCINVGCTPTKTMVASARVAHLARRSSDYGVETGKVSVDLAAVRGRKRSVVESFRQSGTKQLEETEGVELVRGHGRFTGPPSGSIAVEVELSDGGSRALEAETVVIDTGSRTAVPPIDGLEDVPFLDNASIMELDEVPEHLLVLGGGYIGLEFGQMFRRFGARVTIVQMGDQLIPRVDRDVAEAMREILEEEGIEVRLSTQATSARRSGSGGVVLGVEGADGSSDVEGSHLLLAVGRAPNTDDLGLEAVGVETDGRGFVKVDERLRTNVEGVYATGDVKGGPAFTHISYDDFRILRTNLLEGGDATTGGRMVPYTLFTDPQLGCFGMTEKEARERAAQEGLQIAVAKLPMKHVARAIETGETRGLMKAIVDTRSQEILGCAILGVEGGEVMSVLQVAAMGGLPYTALREAVLAHPTLAEALNNLFMTLD